MQPQKKKKGAAGPTQKYLEIDLLTAHNLHWTHLVKACESGRKAVRHIRHELLQSVLRAIIPVSFSVSSTDFTQMSKDAQLKHVRSLTQWMISRVSTVIDEVNLSTEPSSATDINTLVQLAQDMSVSTESNDDDSFSYTIVRVTRRQLSLLLMALFSLLGIDSRLVLSVDPPSWRANKHWHLFKDAMLRGIEVFQAKGAKKNSRKRSVKAQKKTEKQIKVIESQVFDKIKEIKIGETDILNLTRNPSALDKKGPKNYVGW